MKSKILQGNVSSTGQLIENNHPFLYKLWKDSCANNWSPFEIPMAEDIKQWNTPGFLSDGEKLLIKRVLGFFSSGESLVANNIMLNEYTYLKDGAARQYLARKAFEESLHNATIEVCCSSLSLKLEEVAKAYLNIKTIKNKDEFIIEVANDISDKSFDISTIKGKQDFVRNLFAYYLIMEGVWFYPNFAMVLSLGRQNKMIGICDQIRYTLRDESNHIKAGVYFINVIKSEYPEIWTSEFKHELENYLVKAVELEIAYSQETLPIGILGLNSSMFIDYCQWIGNRRLESIGLDYRFKSDKNPFPWLGEQADTTSMSAFFERKERSYQNAGALVDDF